MNRLLDVLTIAVVVLAVGTWAYSRRESRSVRPDVRGFTAELVGTSPTGLTVTDSSGAPVRLNLAKGDTRLLLLVRSDCPACQASEAETRRLLADLVDVRGVAITSERLALQAGYTHYAGLPVFYASPGAVDSAFPRAIAVPTAIILSRSGTVTFARVGLLTPGGSDSLRAALQRAD